MEGLFQGGEQAFDHISSVVRSTFVGRAAGAVDRSVKTAFDTTYKKAFKGCLEERGYQLLGLNTPPRGEGLTRGQREVRFCSYRPEADPYLREARSIAAELLAADTQPATGLVLGKGECLVRVVIPEEVGTVEHAAGFVGKRPPSRVRAALCATGCTGISLGLVGGKDLLVFDLRVSEQTRASVRGIVDKCFGSQRSPPSYYLTQATGAVAAKLAKSKSGQISCENRQYVRFDTPAAEYQYLQSVKLLLLAEALNRAQNGRDTAVHCADMCLTRYLLPSQLNEADIGADDMGDPVWFPPNRGMKTAEESLERSIAALNRAQGSSVGLIPCLPATEFAGTPYEDMAVTITDDQHEELLKQSLRAEGGATQNAFYCGPNITGARPPLDTKNPISWISAYSRHFCRVSKWIPLPNGEVLEVVHDKAEAYHKKLTGYQNRVWDDIINQHVELFREWLQKPLQTVTIKTEGKPHSIDQETYDCVRGEVDWDEEYGARDIIRAAVFCKSGEGGNRARFITMPGVNQADALKHQCGTAAITQIMEKFHTDQFGFRNFKGCSLTGKALKVARFAAHTPDDCVSIGFDKGANDATWTHRKWAKYENCSMQMAAVLTDAYFDDNTPAVMNADEEHVRRIEWRGIYLTVAANIQYYYLMSGIGPTSISNRYGGDVSVGSGILQGYGEKAYLKWLEWSSGRSAEPIDDFESLLYPHMNAGIAVKECLTGGFAHVNEGDDTVIRIVRRKDDTNTSAVTHFIKSICAATNEVWEPAYIDSKHLDSHGGPRSCIEVTSMIVAQVTSDDGECNFAYVPKPIKRLDKMAWTLSAALKVADTPTGRVGVADAAYYRLNATRCLSMCTEMRYALFTRYVVYNTATYHLQRLRSLARVTGSKSENFDKPLYGDRTQEARNMPEATGFIGDSIEKAHEAIGAVLARTTVDSKECLEANANAWGLACPSVLKDGKHLREHLLQLDGVARGIVIEEDHILDPVSYLALFDLGPLEECFTNLVERLSKAVEMSEKSSVPLEVLRQRLVESVSNGQNKSVTAQSQPGTRRPKGAGRGALGRSGKGSEAASSHSWPAGADGARRW
jgi:hypothetical protein